MQRFSNWDPQSPRVVLREHPAVGHREPGEIKLGLPVSSSTGVALPSSVLYIGTVLKLLLYKDSAVARKKEKKNPEKNRKGHQWTYHYMPFSLQRCHLNLFFPGAIFTVVPLQSHFEH